MIIAITGATGFIGKELVARHLNLGDEVRVLTRKSQTSLDMRVKIFTGDLLGDSSILQQFTFGVDVLYHCAAEIKHKDIMFEVNVNGTKNLISAAKNNIKHWVQLSSTGVYGPIFEGVVDESQLPTPHNSYESSKLKADHEVAKAGSKNWFTYSIVRPSNVFGPDMTNQSLFQLIKAIDRKRYFYIGKIGANANYVSVENVVEVLYLAAIKEEAKGEVYNISDTLPLEDFVGFIAKYLNKPEPNIRLPLALFQILGIIGNYVPKSPITLSRVKALTNKVVYSNSKVEKHLGFRSKVSIVDALANLVEKYKHIKF